MDLYEAIACRHSVRSFTDRRLSGAELEELNREIAFCNEQGGLHFQLAVNEEKAFGGMLAHYGKFRNVRNYVALVAKKGDEEKLGYYGERLALRAQSLGLNTCWVGLTFRRRKAACRVESGEKLVCALALGYGTTQGVPHKSKSFSEVCPLKEPPAWFRRGVEAALLAPTAMNRQKFSFTLTGGEVQAAAKKGFYSKVDLGIAKFHFELGAGEEFVWHEA